MRFSSVAPLPVDSQPLDTVKTRMQSIHTRGLYSGTIDALVTIVRKEGWRAWFRGIAAPLLGNAPVNAVMFAAYGNAKRAMDLEWGPDPPGKTSHAKAAIAGGWGGLLQCAITTPMELIKCRQQVTQGRTGHIPGMGDTVRALVSEAGLVRGLFRGFGATVLRDVPSFAAYFWAYEVTKDALRAYAGIPCVDKRGKVVVAPVWVLLTAGSVAGVATWVSCYPIDVVKTAQQTLPEGTPASERTIAAVTRRIWRSEGAIGFTRGIVPTVVRAVPSNAVTFLVYEWCLQVMGHHD